MCFFLFLLVDRLPAVGVWVLVVTSLVVTWVPITKSDTENNLIKSTKQEFALKILTCYNPKVGHSLRVQSSPYGASSFRSDSPGQCHIKGILVEFKQHELNAVKRAPVGGNKATFAEAKKTKA